MTVTTLKCGQERQLSRHFVSPAYLLAKGGWYRFAFSPKFVATSSKDMFDHIFAEIPSLHLCDTQLRPEKSASISFFSACRGPSTPSPTGCRRRSARRRPPPRRGCSCACARSCCSRTRSTLPCPCWSPQRNLIDCVDCGATYELKKPILEIIVKLQSLLKMESFCEESWEIETDRVYMWAKKAEKI